MGLIALPCEISKREFDAKLLLSVRLASSYNKSVLIGYDRYFQIATRIARYATLMDKSCSSIMFKSRIEPVKARGGKVIISDEEGYNNLHVIKESYKARVDEKATHAMDMFAYWGDIDRDFYKDNADIRRKSVTIGNCRADLSNEIGRVLYTKEINSLQNLYGEFLLCSDNFCVEHWRDNYNPPKFAGKEKREDEIQNEYNKYREESRKNREVFADYIEYAATRNEKISFIIRPHPVARPNWWLDRFWKYRNIHISGIKNVEPWIHAATGLVSMGCTTGLQALIANKPLIDIDDDNQGSILTGHAKLFTKLRPRQKKDFEHLIQIMQKDKIKNHQINMDLFREQWANSDKETINIFAEKIDSIHDQKFDHLINEEVYNIQSYLKDNPIEVDSEKWERQNYKDVKLKIAIASKYWKIDPPELYKIAEGLFYLKRK